MSPMANEDPDTRRPPLSSNWRAWEVANNKEAFIVWSNENAAAISVFCAQANNYRAVALEALIVLTNI